ncbi:MAG: cytochrome c [Elusimicrobia bacterium]|nr:cytochrome c [Elusimicrobiota bacterium]
MFPITFLLLSALAALPGRASDLAPDPQDFAQNCANCHTIGGGRLTGPDLKDVSGRRDKEWLLKFVVDPKKMLDGGDPVAAELYKAHNNVLMPTIAGMNAARVEQLLALIDAESRLEKSRFSGLELINRPLLPGDVLDGKALFLGRKPLKNGGPSCVSCHSVGGMSGLGGGLLGPDLTGVFARLGGEKTLAAWLISPASPIMKPVYAARQLDPRDILPLVAFLKDAAQQGRPADSIARLAFLILGLLGAAALYVVLDSLWGARLRGVRRSMVNKRSEAHDV